MKNLTLIIISSIFILSCKKTEDNPHFRLNDESYVSQMEYEVYSVVLNKLYNTSEMFVIKQVTASNSGFVEYTDTIMSGKKYDSTLFTNYALRLKETIYLGNRFMTAPKEVMLIGTEEFNNLFSSQDMTGWDKYYKRYPQSNGIITFGSVGFNESGNMAILQVSSQSHYLAGNGLIVYLEKNSGVWEIKFYSSTWIS